MFLNKWGPVLLSAGFIFLISAIPGRVINSMGLAPEGYHINGHFFMYSILFLTLYRATKKIGWSILVCVLYAISDEYHQSFVPNRSVEMFDIYTDTLGALIAGIIVWKFYQYLPKKLKNWLEQ